MLREMRKCLRCNNEMKEDYDVKVEGAAYGLKITKPGIFKDNLGKVHAAVCPDWILRCVRATYPIKREPVFRWHRATLILLGYLSSGRMVLVKVKAAPAGR